MKHLLIFLLLLAFLPITRPAVQANSDVSVYSTFWQGTYTGKYYPSGTWIQVLGCLKQENNDASGNITLQIYWLETPDGFIMAEKNGHAYVNLPDGLTMDGYCFYHTPSFIVEYPKV